MLSVLIIGGGPHALTLASLLSHPDPGRDSTLSHPCPDPVAHQPKLEACDKTGCSGEKKTRGPKSPEPQGALCPPLSLRVVDSYGEWTGLWESQFTALNIPHLRSHTLVHTDPHNKV